MDAFEREEKALEEALEEGEITLREYNQEMRDLHEDAQVSWSLWN